MRANSLGLWMGLFLFLLLCLYLNYAFLNPGLQLRTVLSYAAVAGKGHDCCSQTLCSYVGQYSFPPLGNALGVAHSEPSPHLKEERGYRRCCV